jgi:hypothetical protein
MTESEAASPRGDRCPPPRPWAHPVRGLAVLAVLAGPAPARAEAPRWELSAAALGGTPAVLVPSVALGATAELHRRLGATPLFIGARLGWMVAEAANESWTIEHHQPLAAVGLGVAGSLGAGRLWAEAGGGASGLYERLGRHQHLRIDAAGVPGSVQSSFAVGPYTFAEIGVGVRLRGAVSGVLAAGPTLVRTRVDGHPLWRAGAGARLGVAYDF